MNRRDFLKSTSLTGLGALAGAQLLGCAAGQGRAGMRADPHAQAGELFRTPPIDVVRVGVVGVGGMGSNHVAQLLKISGVQIKAICDIVAEKVTRAQDMVEKSGQARPTGYDRGPRDFERLCQNEDLDIVYTATPWEWHVPVCVAAMNAGKHAATEVPAAYTIEDCWKLVETAERTRRHCVMLENCCYDRDEMLVLNLVRKGLLGEVLHGECGYLHDLRDIKFSREGEGLWRRAHATQRNGNLYPTHGLGPIAQCMDINRGDRFDYLVSMSGPSRGLQLWQQEKLEASDARRGEQYVLGDVNLSLIKTAKGRTIYLVHDTNLPRPYSRIHMLQGTRGLFQGYPPRVHIEGRSKPHQWQPDGEYFAEFDHPLWRSDDVKKASGGHGGMDFLESYRLIECLRRGEPLDMDVYDAAAWSSICEATQRSVAARSKAIDIPDFTRGAWKTRPPLGIVGQLGDTHKS
ncbi:MAG: Gfo/Idh/MocA family oxidoreductase [Phycisphaerae bacterium]